MSSFVRVDLSDGAEFHRELLELGFPLLDKGNGTDSTLSRIVPGFVAQPQWSGGSVRFHVRDEEGHVIKTSCQAATAANLRGPLKKELDELQERLKNAAPGSASGKQMCDRLSELLQAQVDQADTTDPSSYFFEYVDHQGERRLVWCWGYQRNDAQKSAAAVCPENDCQLLYLQPPGYKKKCPQCHPDAALEKQRPVPLIPLAAVLLLVLLAAGAAFYWFTRPGAEVTGVVFAEADGRPVSNAEIRIDGVEQTTRTDQQGRFQLTGLPTGQASVRVSAAGFQTHIAELDLASGEETSAKVKLLGDSGVTGRIVDAAGEFPVADAEVQIAGTKLTARTDKQGEFRIKQVPSGKTELEISATGYPVERTECKLTAGETATVNMKLTGTARLNGRIVDALAGKPIAGATIRIVDTQREATSDSDGEFAMQQIRAGTVNIESSAQGFRTENRKIELSLGEESSLQLLFLGDAILTGQVTAAASGALVQDAEVSIAGSRVVARTDAEGRFRLPGPQSGEATIEFAAKGFMPKQIKKPLAAGKETALDVSLIGDSILVGEVLDNSEYPVSGAEVRILKTTLVVETDKDGKFRLAGIPNGKAIVEVTATHFLEETIEETFESGKENSLRIVLNGDAILAGQVTDEAVGTPIPNAEIGITGTKLIARADAEGRYRLPGSNHGEASIEIAAEGYLPKQIKQLLAPAEVTTLDTSLVGDAVLIGEVLDNSDKPVSGAEVRIPKTTLVAQTREDGKFRLAGIRSGKKTEVEIVATGFLKQTVEEMVNSGEKNSLRIVLGGDATLTGQVVDEVGDVPIAGASVSVAGTRLTAETNAKGEYRLQGIRSGKAEIEIAAAGFQSRKLPQQLASGKETTLQVVLTGNAVLEGEVINAVTNKPVAGAEVTLSGSRQKTKTDQDGRFRLDKARSGSATVSVTAAGFKPRQVQQDLAADKPTPLRVVLGGDTGLAGTIVNGATERPIAGAKVAIEGTPLSVTTDKKGEFRLEGALAGEAQVIISADGFPSRKETMKLESGKLAQIDSLKLTGRAAVMGTVSDSDKMPIAGAKISVVETGQSGLSDAAGKFSLAALPSGPVTLTASARGYGSENVKSVLTDDKPVSLDLKLTSNLTVRGTAVNAIDGKAITNATATIVGSKTTAKANSLGGFQFESVPAKPLRILVAAEGFYSEEIDVDPVSNSSFRAVLSPKLNPGEVRMVLTWGYSPSDLDAHLYGPLPNGQQFHVSYEKKQAANVLLDVDDRESYGPETITVKKAIPGKYDYKIHAYQDPKEAKRNPEKAKRALARSDAEVKIYSYGNKEPAHYRVDPKAIGTVWHVGYIEVTPSGDVIVKPYVRNHYSDDLPE